MSRQAKRTRRGQLKEDRLQELNVVSACLLYRAFKRLQYLDPETDLAFEIWRHLIDRQRDIRGRGEKHDAPLRGFTLVEFSEAGLADYEG